MSTERINRDFDQLRRPKNEWQAKREAAWRSADQFKYRQMNREHFTADEGFETDDREGSLEDEAEGDSK